MDAVVKFPLPWATPYVACMEGNTPRRRSAYYLSFVDLRFRIDTGKARLVIGARLLVAHRYEEYRRFVPRVFQNLEMWRAKTGMMSDPLIYSTEYLADQLVSEGLENGRLLKRANLIVAIDASRPFLKRMAADYEQDILQRPSPVRTRRA